MAYDFKKDKTSYTIYGKIAFQRGYMDKLSFLKMNGLPIE